MLTIKCAKCKQKLFKYYKLGKGRVLRCYIDRIARDYSRKEGGLVLCPHCSQLIGTEQPARYIALKQNAFIHTGTKE